jgi:histidinol-phosphate aminotransferase
VVFAWRSFEAYPIAVTAASARMVRVPVAADGRHDLDAMADAVTPRTRIVLVCTPNNPTGPAVTQAELDAFIAKVPPQVLIVVDEAYVEFVRMADAVDGVATYQRHQNVLLTRTFSKAYGLAGFRVGYAVGPAGITGALRAVSLPFGVSGVAQAAAIASLEREPELLERVDSLVAERERVVRGLADAGWKMPEPQGNFVWFELGERTIDFAAAADEVGIVVRPFAGEGARVTVAEPEANDRLVALAANWVQEG